MTPPAEQSSRLSGGQAGALSAAAASLPETAASRAARWANRLSHLGLSGYGILGYLFLYLPIIILVFFSFNASRSTAQWNGFSADWYRVMIHDDQIILALWNSLFLAVVSTIISTVIGTLAAMAMERYFFRGKLLTDALLYLPIIIPDIAMAIMLLIFLTSPGLGLSRGN